MTIDNVQVFSIAFFPLLLGQVGESGSFKKRRPVLVHTIKPSDQVRGKCDRRPDSHQITIPPLY